VRLRWRYFAGKRQRMRHIFTCHGFLGSASTVLVSIFVKIFYRKSVKSAKEIFNGTVVIISKQKIIFLLFTTVIFGKF
jgi:hypothetical protein